jgi:ferredoxin
VSKVLKAVVDKSLCTGNGLCVHLAEEAFALDANRMAYPIADLVPDTEGVREAAESCPVAAIFLYDAVTGEEIL